MKRILVIGSLNMDLVLNVDSMPQTGETIIGNGLRHSPGGKGANQACAAGRLGANVAMLGCVGEDNFGDHLARSLSSAGVDIGRIRRHSCQPTGTAVIYVDSRGDNSIVVIPGANSLCDEAYLKENDDLFRQCDYILLQLEIPYNAVWYAVDRANQLGKRVILNPAPAPDTIPQEILERLAYITPNETELAKLSGLPCNSLGEIEAGAREMLRRGVRGVLVTMGEKGALLVSGPTALHFSGVKVHAVDTTAAGDCFNAAFVTALAEGAPPEQAVEFANNAAALAVTREGAQNSLPTRREVEQAIPNNIPID